LQNRELRRPSAITHAGALALPHTTPLDLRQKRLPVQVAAERAWILHKDLVLKAAALGLAVVVIAGAFQMRGVIFDGVMRVAEAASTGMASAGFGISAIDITGQALTGENAILGALDIGPRTSLLAFDAESARQRLLALPAIETAVIRKAYPDRLIVAVTEKTPIARWTVDGVTYLVDSSGERLVSAASKANADLPLVIGQGAGDDAAVIIRALRLHPALGRGVVALSRIGDRRWDVLYDTGLRVQLPETGVTQALKRLDSLERDHALLERDLSLIDMRVEGSIVVRLNEEKPDAEAN